ncbi:MAG: hypothetical protein VYA70_01340 [Gemmatimonadota bacterium]|nr:hypothetical protein [Gemmatimonadota bacterium]
MALPRVPLLFRLPCRSETGPARRALLQQRPNLPEYHQLVEGLPLLGDLGAFEAHDGLAADVDLVAGRRDVVERVPGLDLVSY